MSLGFKRLIRAKNKIKMVSQITPGIITCCKHKGYFYKKLENNHSNNITVAYWYTESIKLLSMFIERQNIENDTINFNFHNKIKTTRAVINTEPLIS